jgi:hypothetical protein
MVRLCLFHFPRLPVAPHRKKIFGGVKCSEPQGPKIFVGNFGWAQRNGKPPKILDAEGAMGRRGKSVVSGGVVAAG